ncbi:hypothetical protein P43SY_003672 [Pythium insidiosum]|uniref:IgA peptidase M64-domain-containing protein n=1 Tax=Pythium insidiosum TaxID=114742 RepID=A0AAD5LUM4_PYTIN|nr:hypothetical protein P43SY_003672 [Pythium insidiosum]
MRLSSLSLLTLAACIGPAVALPDGTFSAKILVDRATAACTLISPTSQAQHHRAIQTPTDTLELVSRRRNRLPSELSAEFDQQFVEILGGSPEAVESHVKTLCPTGVAWRSTPRLRGLTTTTASGETRKLVDSGAPSNRIDVVFMGDGYTTSEKDKFFGDIQRLTNDMFTGDTFTQYLPLFNIWAAFVPSVDSGIGVGGRPKNTAFQLYRDGTELRAVYTANPQAARDLCDSVGADACDFPSLIGNDDFYGGLGGEFVISTRSKTTGTVVLRHEMGHNFGRVGEEYDGGQVYRGANSASSLASVTWKHWLTDPSRLVEEKMAQLYQKHIWYDLKQGAYTISFTSTGTFKRWLIQFSVSGTDTDDSLTVTLDGKPLAWKSNGVKDRSFYQWTSASSGFSKGTHKLVIKAGGSFDSPIIKQLCNAVVYEYMDESQFKMDDPTAIGMYPTFDINKRKTLRPDNERCLMRNMTSTAFCSVCQENMWHQFMARIEFIDDVVVSGRNVSLKLIPLGQLRRSDDPFLVANARLAAAERYSIVWLRDGQELVAWRDKTTADLSAERPGRYSVRVTFTTPSVRRDPNKYMQSERTFTIA